MSSLLPQVGRSSCCCSSGQAWGPSCQPCPPPDSEEYQLVCPGGRGFQPNKDTVILEDIDECGALPDLCQHGRCSNTFGNFMCSCRTGYKLNNVTMLCVDVDECSEGGELCAPGSCRNTEGGFQCSCPPSWRLARDGASCIDERREPCFLGHSPAGQCTSAMSRPQTRLVCCCSMGQAWGEACGSCPPKVERAGQGAGWPYNWLLAQTGNGISSVKANEDS